MWDEITYPFPNFNGATAEVWEWISQVKNISLQYKKNAQRLINKTEAHSTLFVLHIKNVFV